MSRRPSHAARPRLAFYIHAMRGGGAELVSALVASGFAARGHAVDLVLNQAEGPYLRHVTPEVRVVPLDCSSAGALPPLMRYLRAERPACLVSALQHSNLNAALAARLTGTPFAATVHAIMSVHRRNFRTAGVIGTAAQVLSPFIYRAADAIGVVSEAVARDIPYFAKRPDKFHVLHNPIDTKHFSPAPRAGDAAATQALADDGTPIVLGVGRFDRAKNFDLLIRAVHALQDVMPARLVLLGEGSDRARLERIARDLGVGTRVHMPGFVGDPAPWYRRAAVHAIASQSEGFGNTIVESLATGTPVVSACGIGAPVDILDHGRYGTIAEPDKSTMAAALSDAIQQPGDPAALIARANLYTLDACLDCYAAMIDGLIARDVSVIDAERQGLA